MSQQTLPTSRVAYSVDSTLPAHLDSPVKTRELNGIEIAPYQRELDRELDYEVKALGWVVDDSVEQYLEATFDQQVSVPQTYAALHSHEWDPYVARIDGRVYRYGWGINRKLIEAALRVMTGGGQFDAGKYTLYGCGTNPFVLTGPTGTLIGSIGLVGKPSNAARIPTRELPLEGTTVAVPEGSQAILEGVKRAIPLIEAHENRSLTFDTRGPNWMWFTDGSGQSVRIDNEDLATLGQSQPCAEGLSVYDGGILLPTKSWRGGPQQYDWTPQRRVGDPYEHGGVQAGFTIHWDRNRHAENDTYIPEVTSLILNYSENSHMSDEIVLFERSERLQD